MGYPVGPLLQALAERILANLDLIDAQAPRPGSPDQDRPPFSDTQLLISLLGVLVFPHERASEALGELLRGYKPLRNVITIQHPRGALQGQPVELTGPDGEPELVDPTSIKGLPRLLRNSIAHFNILPLGRNGRFSGVRVWNKDANDNVTLVADLDFCELRSLARHILGELAHPSGQIEVADPPDPLESLKSSNSSKVKARKAPRVTDTVWDKLVWACDGDIVRAKEEMDRALSDWAVQIKGMRS